MSRIFSLLIPRFSYAVDNNHTVMYSISLLTGKPFVAYCQYEETFFVEQV